MNATTAASIAGSRQNSWRAVVAASIGNALEWFDLVVYGFFAVTISKLFFPAGNDTVSLLLTLGTFGVSFFMRPLGAIVIGAYSDRAGRKAALTLSILLMMSGTLIIAILPTYQSIGLAAPLILVLARLMQGFSAGGEFGSATAFLAEHVPGRRGFYASWQMASQGLTTLLAAGFGALLTGGLSPEQMTSWGWRVPFFFGLLIGPVAFYIRTKLDETPEFLAAETTQTPLRDTFATQKLRLVIAMGVVILGTVSSYLMLFMPTYGVRQLGLAPSVAFSAIAVTGLIQMVFSPVAGHWSDLHGRTRIMLGAAVLLFVLVYPAFAFLIAHPSFGTLIVWQIVFGFLVSGYFGATPGLLSEIFPVQTRTTGMSLAYNIAVTIFGGFGPFIIAWLISVTGSKAAPSYYVMFAALLSIAALIGARRKLGFR
ncbi:MHS family proline/betaine transporter-like MFS transporter [Paraburkholderia atlantica]|uniref:MHS family proline/betaine transporter-like MFS transporter n=1 Tax=Paraburkholderia atlantica TaxID=2654982 RepID=A0A7W8UY73_PARAM|nr:MFS transporter [Paraburkholderia atlantica]MBB5416202.1 MHS family proline/betaine transporter-like MFS transporter [Paraburkholderia atlantica]MBB5426640.1 MHS family proline/betaine transporter-like MFS transporter [Paraburkholderia atlantica]